MKKKNGTAGESLAAIGFSQEQLELMALPTFCLDAKGRVTGCNSAFERFFAVRRDEAMGKTAAEVLPTDFSRKCYDNDMVLLREGGTCSHEYTLPDSGGRMRRYRVHQSVVTDGSGHNVGIFSQVVDATDGLDDRRNLRRTERLYSNTIDSLDGMLSVVDRDLRVVHSNWKGHEFFPEAERCRKPHCYFAFKGLDAPCEKCTALKVFEDGRKRTVQDRNPIDGSYKSITMVPMFGEDGQVENVVEFVRDITDSKRAELALAEAHERLTWHIENSPLAVIEWDKGSTISAWSKQAERMFGWREEEVLGRHWGDFEFVHPDDWMKVQKEVVTLFMGEHPFNTIENRNLCKDGTVVHSHWFNSPLLDQDGNMVSILSLVADVTELKQYEHELVQARAQAEAANQAKSEFLANMSHEIRTPLNGVIGMLQVLELTDLDGEQGECVDYALQSSRRLNQLLADILDLSRVEAGKMTMTRDPFDFPGLMDGVRRLFDPLARDKGLELQCEFDPSIPTTLVGDTVRLQQVLGNLVGNAIKFTNMGSVVLKAVPIPTGDAGEVRVRFSVEDTGIGITEEAQGKLFKPFSQIEGHFTRKFQGAGLGLSICKRLVELMGGDIAVESAENIGSRFHFSVAFGVAEQEERAAAADVVTPRGPLKVVVAEDDPVSRDLMVRLLQKEGHQVAGADDGVGVLELLRGDDFDLVFMDVQMPVMNGVESTAAIRRGDAGEAARSIPIIAMTAYAMMGDREKFLEAGMDDYLSKPVDFGALWQAVDSVMASSRK